MSELSDITRAIIGGTLIGIASSLFLVFKGRVFGVSGLLGMSIDESNFKGWRMLMVAFLIIGGGLSNYLIEGDIGARIYEYRSIGYLVFGGLLIGFGTRMGSGCTSGHGVCGISRLSPRSIVATVTFMFAGAAAVYFIKTFLGA